jgi:hypothetical protein
MTDWPPRRRLDDLPDETVEAIAEDLRDPGPGAGDGRQADVEAARYERWLDTWP